MGRIVKLPKPDCVGSVTLEKVISQRRSRRDYLPKLLTPEQISQLCWAAQGESFSTALGKAPKFRTVPSAGATYPLEVFVATEEGLGRYLPGKHSIEDLTDEDLREKLAAAAWGQGFVKQAGATFVLAAEFERATGRYDERGVRYIYMEAGHAAQNIHLEAESLGLGSVAVGAFDDAAVKKVLSLPDNLEPLYMVVVGHYRK